MEDIFGFDFGSGTGLDPVSFDLQIPVMVRNENPTPYWIADVVHDIEPINLEAIAMNQIHSKVKIGTCIENPCSKLPIKSSFYKNYGSIECESGQDGRVLCNLRCITL